MSLKEEETEKTAPEAEAAEQQEEAVSETEKLQKELEETEEKYKRVLAEYQNFRTRTQKEKESLYLDSAVSTVSGMLPVIDTLERAVQQETNEEFKKSLDLIIKQYGECLEKLGVKPFGERGQDFDPNIHNAVMHTDDESLGENQIAEVLLKGYMLGERVVRHAMVKVAN